MFELHTKSQNIFDIFYNFKVLFLFLGVSPASKSALSLLKDLDYDEENYMEKMSYEIGTMVCKESCPKQTLAMIFSNFKSLIQFKDFQITDLDKIRIDRVCESEENIAVPIGFVKSLTYKDTRFRLSDVYLSVIQSKSTKALYILANGEHRFCSNMAAGKFMMSALPSNVVVFIRHSHSSFLLVD